MLAGCRGKVPSVLSFAFKPRSGGQRSRQALEPPDFQLAAQLEAATGGVEKKLSTLPADPEKTGIKAKCVSGPKRFFETGRKVSERFIDARAVLNGMREGPLE